MLLDAKAARKDRDWQLLEKGLSRPDHCGKGVGCIVICPTVLRMQTSFNGG
jgi:hypothetical protein